MTHSQKIYQCSSAAATVFVQGRWGSNEVSSFCLKTILAIHGWPLVVKPPGLNDH